MIENLCNCDARDEVNVDVGVLTSKDQLPVMMLAYGDSRERASWIQYRKMVFKSLFTESTPSTSILLKGAAYEYHFEDWGVFLAPANEIIIRMKQKSWNDWMNLK